MRAKVLKSGTPLVIGFMDRDSALGQYYLDHKATGAGKLITEGKSAL
jgi:hypothetical protein